MASSTEAEVSNWSVSSVWRSLNKPVFVPAVIIIAVALIFATWFGRAQGAEAFEDLNTAIVDTIGWWYVLICTLFIAFGIWAAFSKAGSIRLGRDDEKPEFSLMSWFTMLFSAGMGIGLVFWGVAEPLWHFTAPPEISGDAGVDADGNIISATQDHLLDTAMGATVFHWGLHAWAIYVVVGLGLAYMTFRRGRPLTVRWLLEPIFGHKLIESWVGHVIDVIAIVGTIFGVVTSLGLGVQQIAAGLGFMGWAESSNMLLTILVICITAIAVWSVVSGVDKGLKWLSNINMSLAALLALFVLIFGPTLLLLQAFVTNIGEYVWMFPQLMFETSASYAGGGTDGGWSADWTIYYWGWWMSWSPFVGMFIARISRGRTVRQFITGVLLAPTLIGILWFSIFGNAGLYYQIRDGIMVGEDGSIGQESSLFTLLEQLPLSAITAVVAILVVTFFFVTSSDSGSLVVDILSHGGRTETPRLTRVFWALVEGASAIILLTAAGEAADAALRVLQISSIAAAAPMSIVIVLAMLGMIRMFIYDGQNQPRYIRLRPHATKTALVDAAREAAGTEEGPAVERNLRTLASRQARVASRFLGGTSTTLAGLRGSEARSDQEQEPVGGTEDMVFAVHDVPPEATAVDPATGTLSLDIEATPDNPLTEEAFDTPEYAESAAGWQHESEQLYEEVVGTGEMPVVENPSDDEQQK
ncbi:BCCT family transporter [Nesterenkonia halophila]